MANKDLFKQAIAEAKAIREAAILNAKEALEETLTPHLKDMLAAKLQEMENNDMEEEVEEGKDKMDTYKESSNLTMEEEEMPAEESEEEEAEMADTENQEEEELEVKDMEVEDLKDLIRDLIAQEMAVATPEEELPAEELPVDDMVGAEDEEEIDLDELLREINELSEEEEVAEYGTSRMKEPSDAAASGFDNIIKQLKDIAEKGGDAGKKAYAALEKLGAAAASAIAREEVSPELEEAITTVNELRSQLQEVNLLNAKLLYVNKVFKKNNLTESQKVNVIAAFDKAETVKEVELVFETISNSVVKAEPKKIVRESKMGMASKATGVTAKKPQVITEVNETVKRMQKLAGIIK